MIAGLLFYMFALVLIASSVMVVTARQPVTAVLFLVLAFFNAAGLFLLVGAEFLAFILLIVYVGAVAVLFLFVVMMLDVKGAAPREALRQTLPIGLGVGGVLLVQMLIAIWAWPASKVAPLLQDVAEAPENTRALGRVLYTDFAYPFQVVGLILLVAMIGAITLTYRKPRHVKKQKVWAQLDVRREDVVELRKVKSGEGAL
ncbi:MAG: NADH-quinone oxidoreductase subunit J [Alphaproteobacteria bacterium]|nr:NADH-quinone oxidoreductase subunit J [Alphaproteobacteria bacterium]